MPPPARPSGSPPPPLAVRSRERGKENEETYAGAPLHAAGEDHVIEQQHDDSADHGHEHAVDVEARHAGVAQPREQPAAHHCADYPENDVEEHAFAGLVDDLAADESGDQS